MWCHCNGAPVSAITIVLICRKGYSWASAFWWLRYAQQNMVAELPIKLTSNRSIPKKQKGLTHVCWLWVQIQNSLIPIRNQYHSVNTVHYSAWHYSQAACILKIGMQWCHQHWTGHWWVMMREAVLPLVCSDLLVPFWCLRHILCVGDLHILVRHLISEMSMYNDTPSQSVPARKFWCFTCLM